jgi:hypothetical protein
MQLVLSVEPLLKGTFHDALHVAPHDDQLMERVRRRWTNTRIFVPVEAYGTGTVGFSMKCPAVGVSTVRYQTQFPTEASHGNAVLGRNNAEHDARCQQPTTTDQTMAGGFDVRPAAGRLRRASRTVRSLPYQLPRTSTAGTNDNDREPFATDGRTAEASSVKRAVIDKLRLFRASVFAFENTSGYR